MASIGVVEPMSAKAVVAVTPMMPRDTPNSAVSTGSPAATSEPKVRTRTTRATPMPISSEEPPSSGTPTEPAPLASTCRPSTLARSMVSSSASMVAGSTSATVSTSKSQVIVPTRPSALSGDRAAASASAAARGVPLSTAAPTSCSSWAAAASTGSVSGVSGICGSCSRSATRSSTCAATAGSDSVRPSGAATTTWTVARSKASTAPGKSSDCRSAARSEGMPGIEKESDIGLAKPAARAPTPIRATSQAATNTGQRR